MKKRKTFKFDWDAEKAARNEEKYGVTFEEATSIFTDRYALFFDDAAHSQKEKREVVIGYAPSTRRHITCFFTRVDGSIFIIAARKSTHRERQDYKDNSEDKTRIVYQIK